jgi:hypothetical protein
MTRPRKPIPKNQSEITQEATGAPYVSNLGNPVNDNTVFFRNRGNDISMKEDTVKDISIGLQDIDEAIMYYFDNVIKPTVVQDGNRMAVRTIYGFPERWKSIQADGFYRDGNGQGIVPLIVFKRDNIEKVRTLGNKIDGNAAALYQVVGTKYNSRNQYDNFSILNNRIPSEQYYVTTVPDYITLTYSCIIFTNFVEQNNKIVEAIEFASDSYWGDPNRFKFRTSIDSFATTVTIENGADRAAKSTFNFKVNGYIIPDTVNKDLATLRSKFYTKSQVIFDLEVVSSTQQLVNIAAAKNTVASSNEAQIDQVTFANEPEAFNSMGASSFIGGGINVTNANFNISAADAGDLDYLNTNVGKTANIVTAPNVAIFTGAALLQPNPGSSLPPTSASNFTFFVNGVNVDSSLVTIVEAGGNVTLVLNTNGMGYTLIPTDEVVASGKFQ